MTEQAAKPGQRRPTAEDIPLLLERVCEGKSLRAACRELGIHSQSVHAFIDSDPALRDQYARAKEQRAEVFQEDVLTIAKAAALGAKHDGRAIDPAGARVYIDAVKWAAGRMAPKSGPVHRVSHSYEKLTDDELNNEIVALAAELNATDDAGEP